MSNIIEITPNACNEITIQKENELQIVIQKNQPNEIIVSSVGLPGPSGDSYQETFESVSKNIKSWDYVLNYTTGTLTSIVYTDGVDTITKTLNYTTGTLTSLVLSGDTPSGITLTKTLNYTTGVLTSVAYS